LSRGAAVGRSWAGPLWALLAGVVWALCFGARSTVVAPWLALAPLMLLLGSRRPVLACFLHGFAFWIAGLYWIPATIITFGKVPPALASLGLVLLAAFLSLLFWIPFGLLGRRLWQAGGWRLHLGLPALWVALEWAREYLLSGFPWNLAAYAAVDVPGGLPLAALVGAYGVSFVVVGVNTAMAVALRERRPRHAGVVAAAAAAALIVGMLVTPRGWQADKGQLVKVLQPNIPNLETWDPDLVGRNYLSVLEQATAACEQDALVILPESATWPYIYGQHPHLANDLARLTDRGCRIFLNSIREDDGAHFNSALLVGREGVEAQYDKRHLVPFGEYVPMAGLLPFVDKLARMAGDFAAGSGVGLLPWAGEQLGTAICYEVVYPAPVAAQVRAGATVLVTVTNDAWYGDTSAPWQHLRAAQFRAAETARPMLRAAITGVSAIIGPDGRVRSLLGVGERGVLEGRVTGIVGLTPHTRAPWLVPLACALLALGACARFRAP